MTKQIYFRLIELENHQILLQKSFDNEEQKPELIVSYHLHSCCIQQNHVYKDESIRDKFFDTYTNEQAQKMIDSTLKLLEDNDTTI